MHDWQEAIRKKLDGLAMSRTRREELISELSSHLDDLYTELVVSGVAEPAASAQCLQQLNDVRQIAVAAKQSQVLERVMNQRSRTFWLPGLVTLTLASVSLTVMQLFAFSRPRVYWVDGGNVAVGIFWLLSLLPCGALGTYLARRAGGSGWGSVVVSLFPSLTMLGVFCVVLPIGIFIERNTYILHHLRYFGLALLAWTIVPAVPSVLGALPVLGKMRVQNRNRADMRNRLA